MQQNRTGLFDPAWYVKELSDCAGAVVMACVRDGAPAALCELYPLGMRVTDGARLLSARAAFQECAPLSRQLVADFCLKAGLIHRL